MNNLYTYISQINNVDSRDSALDSIHIVNSVRQDNSYQEVEGKIEAYEILYSFNNGVTIQCSTEAEQFEVNPQVCPECWISYQVITDLADNPIKPHRKNFINHCQQAFWLKMNSAQ